MHCQLMFLIMLTDDDMVNNRSKNYEKRASLFNLRVFHPTFLLVSSLVLTHGTSRKQNCFTNCDFKALCFVEAAQDQLPNQRHLLGKKINDRCGAPILFLSKSRRTELGVEILKLCITVQWSKA